MQCWKSIFPVLTVVFLVLFFSTGCGSGSTDDDSTTTTTDDTPFTEDTITFAVTVAEPVAADLSVPTLTFGKKGLVLKSPALATQAGASYDVMVKALQGYPTFYFCTTDETGTCEVEVPVRLAVEGFQLLADDGTFVMKSVEAYTQEEVDALQASGGSQAEAINPVTDLTAAIVTNVCDGNVANCPQNLPSLVKSVDVLVSDAATRTDHEEDSTGEVISNLVDAHEALIQALAGDEKLRAERMMHEALADEATADIEALGVTVSDQILADINTAAGAVAEAYCGSTDPVWPEAVTDAAAETGLDPGNIAKTVLGVIEELEPSEIGEISTTELQNHALSVTKVGDLVEKGVMEQKVRQAIAGLLRQGAMADSDIANIEQAVGLLTATFREMTDFSTFNPESAARTAHLFNAQLVNDTTTRYSAEFLAGAHAAAFKDPSIQLSLATGGKRAFGTYLTNFIVAGTAFNATASKGDIIGGSGESCTTDSDCAASLCVDGVCNAMTTTLGLSCEDADDCTAGEICAGYRRKGRFCMRANDVPPTIRVFQSGGASPVFMNAVAIASGEAGSACPCASSYTCTSSVASAGVCIPSALTGFKAPGMTCTGNTQCISGGCSTGRCTFSESFLSTLGTLKAFGEPCTSSYQCQTAWCGTGAVCDVHPYPNLFTAGGVTLSAAGSACTYGYQCSSGFCNNGQCSSFTGGDIVQNFESGTKTSGQTCGFTSECAPPLQCVSGTCSGYTQLGSSCSASLQCGTNEYCKEFACVAKATVGGNCAATTTNATGEACAGGFGCRLSDNQCRPAVTVQLNFPAPVTSKNVESWIGAVANFPNALYRAGPILINGGQTAMSFLDVPPGTYFIGGWANLDGDNARNKGDYRGFFGGPTGVSSSKPPSSATAVVPASGIANFNFPLFTIPSVFVNVTLPASVTNKPATIVINTASNLDGAPYTVNLPPFSGNLAAVRFDSLTGGNVPAGTYFVGAWVDLNGNGLKDSGDYRGWHNGSGSNPPGGPSFTVPAGGDITVNFPIQTIP